MKAADYHDHDIISASAYLWREGKFWDHVVKITDW